MRIQILRSVMEMPESWLLRVPFWGRTETSMLRDGRAGGEFLRRSSHLTMSP